MTRSIWQGLAVAVALAGAWFAPARHEVVARSDDHEHALSVEGVPTRVEALRAGARRGEATGMLVKLVEHRVGEAVTWHLETSLPGVQSVVHLVEEHTPDGSRLIHREATGTRGRTLRLVSTAEGVRDLVTYGEGRTLRRDPQLPRDVVLPLERLDLERTGRAEPGPFTTFDPLVGRAERLVAERSEFELAGGVGASCAKLVVWQHVDSRGDLVRRAWFVGQVLVAYSPTAGRALATVVDPKHFDELRQDTSKAEKGTSAADLSRWR